MTQHTKTEEKRPLDREQIAAILAMHYQPGWIVNLGIGIPTRSSSFVAPDDNIIFHAEQGLIGYGEIAPDGSTDHDVTNAGGQRVTLIPGAVIVDHAESFALVRRGLLDCTALGAYEVAQDGSFANWSLDSGPFMQLGGIGGAMDLAACAKHTFLAMKHMTEAGEPRLLKKCTLPVTAPAGTVSMVVTDLGVFGFRDGNFELREYAPGYTVEAIQAVTGAKLLVSPDLRPVAV